MYVSSLSLSWVSFRPNGVPELGCELCLVTKYFLPFQTVMQIGCLYLNRCIDLSFFSPLQTEQHGTKRLEPSSAKTLIDIGTRRIFSSEHDIFRESARKFFQEEVLPFHAE